MALQGHRIGGGVFTGDHAVGRRAHAQSPDVRATSGVAAQRSQGVERLREQPCHGGLAVGAGDAGDRQRRRRRAEEPVGDGARLMRQSVHRGHPHARSRGGRLDPRRRLPKNGANTAGERNVECRKTMGAPTRTGEEQAVVLDGATVERRAGGTNMQQEMEIAADRLRSEGARPYVIPGGGSNPVGALGYVNAAFELIEQAASRGLKIDYLVHATGSAGTQAGLVAGLYAANSDIRLLGIGTRAPKEKQEQMVYDLACRTLDHMGMQHKLAPEVVVANCDYVGSGYGIPTRGMVEAVQMLARTEGLLLDPVYSGKGMAGLVDLIRKGYFKPTDNVVFLHTGGSVALFGYPATFEYEYSLN